MCPGNGYPRRECFLLSPQGRVFDQKVARELSAEEGLILVCGRYEGIDERIGLAFADEELSVGDFVLTGGEIPAMLVIDAVTRLIPGTLGDEGSAGNDSFADDLLEHGHYTRPRMFEGMAVPEVLLSGDHGRIDRWRQEMSMVRTFLKRRELLVDRRLDSWEIDVLQQWRREIDEMIDAQSVRGADSPSGEE